MDGWKAVAETESEDEDQRVHSHTHSYLARSRGAGLLDTWAVILDCIVEMLLAAGPVDRDEKRVARS